MITSLVLAIIVHGISLDEKFCPRDPAPVGYEDSLALRLKPNGKVQQAYSAISITRLLDRKTNTHIGWLVLDDAGVEYVVFKKLADHSIYAAFKPHNLLWERAIPYSVPMPLTPSIQPIPPFVARARPNQ
jgi:hypothetical protein